MKTCDLLIQNTTVMADCQTIKTEMDIALKDGRILEVVPSGTQEYEAKEILNGKGRAYMPGLIDSHMHTGQQLLKGLVLDAKPIIWTRIMLPFESTLTPEKMKLSAQVAALEMIKSGTTAFVDAGSYYMDAAAGIYYESGLRGCLSCSTMDEEGLPESIATDAEAAVEATDRLYEEWHGKGNLKVYYSLRALNSCSDDLIRLAHEHAAERGAVLQAHMNEYQAEVDGIVKRTGMRPYEFLEKEGILSERLLGTHSLLLSEQEKELVKDRGVRTCHCPFSNCGKAVPDTPDLIMKGILPGFGTDGAAHGGLSLWSEMKIFRSVMNIYHGVPHRNPKVMPAETLFGMMFEGGAAAIDEKGTCGKIQAGYRADLIGVDIDQPHMLPTGNLLHTLFECGDAGDVKEMIVGGKVIMKNREVFTLDEEKIMYEAKEYMKKAGTLS